jgi:IS5 family transposase
MKQPPLAMAADQGAGLDTHRRPTRRDRASSHDEHEYAIGRVKRGNRPHYATRGEGHPAIGPERMMRIHFMQHRFNLADFRPRRSAVRQRQFESLIRD